MVYRVLKLYASSINIFITLNLCIYTLRFIAVWICSFPQFSFIARIHLVEKIYTFPAYINTLEAYVRN